MTILSYGSMISKNSGELKLCRTYIAHSIICIIIIDVFVCDCNHPKDARSQQVGLMCLCMKSGNVGLAFI